MIRKITNVGHKINDKPVQFISIPAIALVFPNITNLIINTRYDTVLLIIQYAYFLFLVYIIWKGNIWLVILVKRKINIEKSSYNNYLTGIIFSSLIFTGLVAGLLLITWTKLFKENRSDGHTLLNSTLLLIFISIFITILYENYLLNKKKLNALSKIERMNFARTQAELIILKSQIDPHFLFNSFNTLSYLISSNPANAKLYNDTLARVYQYILINKQKDLVPLRQEIEFVSNYFYLLTIRFENAISMIIEIDSLEAEGLLIPPISLQTLIENAVKHNSFDDDNPLVISVSVLSNQVVVSNRITDKDMLQLSSKTGLTNLENRYKLITNKSISISNDEFFVVKLPMIST